MTASALPTPTMSLPAVPAPTDGSPTIVHLTAEYSPYARTGGLAEAVNGLATFQSRAGAAVVVFVPLYRSVRDHAPDLAPLGRPIKVDLGFRSVEVRFFREVRPAPGPRVVFVDAPQYFNRSALYGENGQDYPDNARRFAVFSRAVLDGISRLIAGPVLVHAHDWHASARADVHAHLRGAARALRRHAHRALGAQRRLPGALPREHAQRLRHPVRGVQLAHGGVVRPHQLSQDRARLRRRRGHGEPGARAASCARRAAASGCTPPSSGLATASSASLNGIDQHVWDPATDDQITANYTREDTVGQGAVQGRAAALVRAAAAQAHAALRHDRTHGHAEGARPDPRTRTSCGTWTRSSSSSGKGEPRYERALTQLAERAAAPRRRADSTSPTGSSIGSWPAPTCS